MGPKSSQKTKMNLVGEIGVCFEGTRGHGERQRDGETLKAPNLWRLAIVNVGPMAA